MESERLPYVSTLAAVQEVNRCPGGKHTIGRIAQRLNIGPHSRVLEIGSNTGFTTFELTKLTGCRVSGIDIDPHVVAEAQRAAVTLGQEIADRVDFRVGSAASLPFDDDAFDAVICGGANTFIADRQAAFGEYQRVLRRYGFLSITNLYYHSEPPIDLQDRLADVLGFRVPPFGLKDWLQELMYAAWEFYDLSTSELTARPEWVVDAYVDSLQIDPPGEPTETNLSRQWRHAMHTFNDNHRYLSFLELTLRQDTTMEQPELFLAPGKFDPFIERAFVSRV
jgi:ubiquinone/menaquinone biosynthesis C-methylase UbiE